MALMVNLATPCYCLQITHAAAMKADAELDDELESRFDPGPAICSFFQNAPLWGRGTH
jgi:hypothetical protein